MELSSIISMVIAGSALILSLVTTLKKNTKEDTTQIAQMMTMLNNLASDMKEIKEDFRRDIAEMKANYQRDHDNLVILDRDLKTAWRNIDEIKLQIANLRNGS